MIAASGSLVCAASAPWTALAVLVLYAGLTVVAPILARRQAWRRALIAATLLGALLGADLLLAFVISSPARQELLWSIPTLLDPACPMLR